MQKSASPILFQFIAAISVPLMILQSGLAYADHEPGHDEVARGGVKALEERVWDLEQALQNLPRGPAVISVDCSAGELIQDALDSGVDGDTVEVSGACIGDATIAKDRVQLVGLPGAAISGTVRVRGNNVVIRDFSDITSATGTTIFVINGASATIDSNSITSTSRHGIAVFRSSHARIINNNITGADHGVIVSDSSSASVFLNTITGSGDFGVYSLMSSSARVDGNTITGNRRGLVIARSGTMRLSGAAGFGQPNILQNTQQEVTCSGFSALRVDAPQTFLDPPTDTSIGADCKLDGNHGTLP